MKGVGGGGDFYRKEVGNSLGWTDSPVGERQFPTGPKYN